MRFVLVIPQRFRKWDNVILKHEELKTTIENKLEILDEAGHVIVPLWVT